LYKGEFNSVTRLMNSALSHNLIFALWGMVASQICGKLLSYCWSASWKKCFSGSKCCLL